MPAITTASLTHEAEPPHRVVCIEDFAPVTGPFGPVWVRVGAVFDSTHPYPTRFPEKFDREEEVAIAS